MAGLGPSTFRQYHSRVVQLTEHGYEPTLNGLGRFLADRASQDDARFFAHASLGTWRSAIVHFGVGLGYYFPTEVDKIEFRKLKSGLKSMNAEGITRVKGAITRKLVHEVISFAKTAPGVPKEHRQWFVNGVIVQHAFGLRTSEVPGVNNDNTQINDENDLEYLHTCPKNKDVSTYSRSNMLIEQHFSDVHWKKELDRICSEVSPDNSQWVSGWCSWQANRYV